MPGLMVVVVYIGIGEKSARKLRVYIKAATYAKFFRNLNSPPTLSTITERTRELLI